ncbi:uncharacterized protein K460DRAFT_405841 [Cucurbitaria berberidis CBS 394.84]|uniref:F-box domain-containing protein n=1 Tax=Cucurbitaria berberidis CBS 394.84 TaxID=1168544 RepID=A0A9P4GI40_9PLEO|nr:uncharacterized protein K460DRAFT_405841 [Cucurbitaria berberidis CBS 394.84]KAF1845591.1 hypothetical protein K460DRAFT_405841 [Cucurbitaria berberidis CBS 394.84]
MLPEMESLTTDPQDSRTHFRFVELPGEIRNQIYLYAIYPELSTVIVCNCEKPEHFGSRILRLPLFRISRQIRAESLSFLCATKTFKILGIVTANAFFQVIGTAIGKMKSMTLLQPLSEITPSCKERTDRFFSSMTDAKALKEFRLEGLGNWVPLCNEGEYYTFVRRVRSLGQGKDIEIHVRFGKYG